MENDYKHSCNTASYCFFELLLRTKATGMHLRFPIILLAVFLSCNAYSDQDRRNYASPKGYSLDTPTKFRMRESMGEISGIVLHPDEKNIVAINDEEGKVFLIDVHADKPYPTWKFGKAGDYEDIVYTGKDWLVLKSNGMLYQVHGLFTDSTSSTSYRFPEPGQREFESAYFDPQRNSVVVICKNCGEDKKQYVTSAYQFDMGTLAYNSEPVYKLDVKEIAKLSGTALKNFKPSAAAIHPIEKRLYIISSVNGLLVITDMQGKVQEVYNLKRHLFPQPEGLSFAPNGDMYISNEGGDALANILKFSYHGK
jgi:hypothetical protein